MKTCWNCRTKNINGEVFCKRCGQNIADVVIESDSEVIEETHASERSSSNGLSTSKLRTYDSDAIEVNHVSEESSSNGFTVGKLWSYVLFSSVPVYVVFDMINGIEDEGFKFVAFATLMLWAGVLIGLLFLHHTFFVKTQYLVTSRVDYVILLRD
jgi:hypothetical protein